MKDTFNNQLMFSAVPPAVLDVVWPDVAPLLQKATDTSNNRYDLNSVHNALRTGKIALWVVMDGTTPIAALTTRVSQMPGTRALAIDWMGGTRMREWLPQVHETLSSYGKAYGCTEMHGFGRRAWLRWLAPHGWEQDYIAYRVDLTDG